MDCVEETPVLRPRFFFIFCITFFFNLFAFSPAPAAVSPARTPAPTVLSVFPSIFVPASALESFEETLVVFAEPNSAAAFLPLSSPAAFLDSRDFFLSPSSLLLVFLARVFSFFFLSTSLFLPSETAFFALLMKESEDSLSFCALDFFLATGTFFRASFLSFFFFSAATFLGSGAGSFLTESIRSSRLGLAINLPPLPHLP